MPDSLTDLDGLQASIEDFLSAILEATAQPIWVMDPDGVIRFANTAAIATLGYEDAAELLGRHSHETIHYKHPNGTVYPVAESPMLLPRTTGETVTRELDWFLRRDGSMVPVSYVAVPLAMPRGRGAVVAFTDIDDRRRAPQALREQHAMLAEQHASLRRVAVLVADGAASAEVFTAIAREVAQLMRMTMVNIWRFEPDGTATVMGTWHERAHPFQPGTTWTMGVPSAAAAIAATTAFRPARIDDFSGLAGPFAQAVRESGIGVAVVAPIIVGGEMWGMIATGAAEGDPLPDGIEDRLAEFTELVGTAIANAESRAGLARLAEEQAALRRVAMLVAREAPQAEIFAGIAEEIGQLVGADYIRMVRFEDDRMAVVVASAGVNADALPGGSRVALGGNDAISRVFRTGRPARIDDYRTASGPIAQSTHAMGIRGVVGTPILVGGRLWGAMGAGTTQLQPLPPETESRLGQFTALMATAIANTESHARAERLAEEQAALRRVATLVAKESPPAELFAKVVEELANVFGEAECLLFRDEGDATATVVASCGAGMSAAFAVGTRLPTDGDSVAATVLREGRPHRVDDYASTTGTIAQRCYENGARSAVGCPVRVRGSIWGVIGAVRYQPEAFPPETETRMTEFADLVATAIANAAARTEVQRLAEEQAALRRVATLVAEGASATAVFDAVAAEMERLLDADNVTLSRYEGAGEATIVAHRGPGAERMPPGSRVRREGQSIEAIVWRTERPARIEQRDQAHGVVVGTPIVVDGRLWGAITAGWADIEAPPADSDERVAQFAELLDTAIANADSRDQLTASRARLLTEADEARRRVVRDLHDGAQQRQVHSIITLKLAVHALRSGSREAEALVVEALENVEQGNEQLRDLAHGILPRILTDSGLHAAIATLVTRTALPVAVDVPNERFPPAVEASAYFIVAEALTNVVKHAHAKQATIRARVEDGNLRVRVRDDGVGGARSDGSGLLGLADRLAVLNGRLRIESPADGGTLVAADIPLAE